MLSHGNKLHAGFALQIKPQTLITLEKNHNIIQQNKDTHSVALALKNLEQFGPVAVPTLLRAARNLPEDASETLVAITESLTRIIKSSPANDQSELTKQLENFFTVPNSNQRWVAAITVAGFYDDEKLDQTKKLLTSKPGKYMADAAAMIFSIAARPSDLKFLQRQIHYADLEQQQFLFLAIGNIDYPESRQFLVETVNKSKNAAHQEFAVQALENGIGDGALTDLQHIALTHRSFKIRGLAISSLSEKSDRLLPGTSINEQSVAALKEFLADSKNTRATEGHRAFTQQARDLLKKISPPHAK